MAQSMPDISRAIFTIWRPYLAEEFALAQQTLGEPIDRERYDADRARFMDVVDTPDKLFRFSEALGSS
jgi:hypothetical protein